MIFILEAVQPSLLAQVLVKNENRRLYRVKSLPFNSLLLWIYEYL